MAVFRIMMMMMVNNNVNDDQIRNRFSVDDDYQFHILSQL